ncbi:DUF5336 domain-containing protein [Mycobacterium sp. MYCO198283]|uniref:DUF5336 domain-containing protein n=1 Tax=Mycobacterium sp. MYCO198283 TaxID=2883505 RepID=UPI001E4CB62B|nr:DUF5336 domain-containing protein [Mycobacterium sp. MYCO198283]MCG5431004.1 DUF5336 domain-containing protein [Mycobacterium sp. MYCO198283]
MTYPPGNAGYPSASQPGQYGGQGAQPDQGSSGDSKLPKLLTAAAAVLGLGSYVAAFGPFFDDTDVRVDVSAAVLLSILAAMLAVATLLPKQRNYTSLVAALSVTAFLAALVQLVTPPDNASVGWGLIALVVFTALQALASVANLLFHSGVISPPAPRQKYDPYSQYGAPGQYYGPPSGQLPVSQQRPGGYGQPQHGGYGGSTGGFPVQGQQPQYGQPQQGGQPQGGQPQHSASATPPTGYPSFSQPPGSPQQPGQQPTQQIPTPTQQLSQPGQQPPS